MAIKTIIRKKTSNVSISLPNDVREMAERYAKEQDITFSQLVRQSLKDVLAKPYPRKPVKLLAYLKKQGINI